MNSLLAKLGKKVRELRKTQKLSQKKLAQKAGLHYTYIGAVERGERNLSLRSMEKIAKGLKVNIAEFFPSPQTLSPKGQVIEKIVNLLRHKELKVLQLVLRVAKTIIQGDTSERKKKG